MAARKLTPMKFKPKLVSKIWGARRLETVLGKKLPDNGRYGESWEVSAHPGDLTPVVYPEWLAGKTIPQIAASEMAEEAFGKHADMVRKDGFPLLYKFLDADDVLSVQVHPDDGYARTHEGDNGKTECWVVIEAQSGSILYKGFKPGTDLAKFEKLLGENKVEECLNSFEVHLGDVVFIPAKTVHAIGAGILLAEIQQSSDVTYRVYDWGRLGNDGQPRPVHVQQAKAVMDVKPPAENTAVPHVISEFKGGRHERLAACNKFVLERVIFETKGKMRLGTAGEGHFSIFSVLDGETTLSWKGGKVEATRGDSFLVPAGAKEVQVAATGRTAVLNAYLPD
jgi:mannose-6-phosphate isomerase